MPMKGGIIAVFCIAFLLLGCSKETALQEELEMANHCDTADDCVLLGSKCPFGCYIYANKDEAARLSGFVDKFQSNCEYSCIRCTDVKCENSKCVPICE